MIKMTEELFLGKGTHKKCYRHPLDNDKCIKFSYTEEGKKDLDREIRYQGILSRGGKDLSVLPKYYGAVTTNYGQGYVYELIIDYDGVESKTLAYYFENEMILKENLSFLIDKLTELRDYLLKNNIITMGLFPGNIIFQKINNYTSVVRIVNDMGSAALIPLEYYFSFVAKKRISKRWKRFLKTLMDMYPNDTTKILIKKIS